MRVRRAYRTEGRVMNEPPGNGPRPVVGICADRKTVGLQVAHVAGEKYVNAVVDGAH
ncbi:gamma-glutamyl-gamma-aminobutyrate hydrolase family protein, partial [Burkholderia pseudomallei]